MPIYRSARKNFYVVWHHGRWYQKILFCTKPFLQDLIFVWLDVWSVTPLPAIVKFVLSVVIVGVMMLPVAYFLMGTLFYLGLWQNQIESLYPMAIPVQIQIHYWFKKLFQQVIYSDTIVEQWQRRMYRILLIGAGTIDYMRLMLEIV